MGIRHRHDVRVFFKILGRDTQLLAHLIWVVVQVPTVQAPDDLEHPGLACVQPCVNCAEHRSALLDQRLSCAHRRVRGDVSDLFLGGGDYALSCVGQPAQELKQHGRRWVKWHRHGDLANIVYARRALNFRDLGGLNHNALTGYLAALDLEHRGGVVYMSSVKQSP